MDNLEYLNQIAQSSRPVAPAKKSSGLFSSSIFKIAIGGIIAFFILIAVGSLLGSLGNKANELTKQLLLRTNNLNATITAYNPVVKPSGLRAIGSSLSTVLTHSSNQLNTYLVGDSEDKDEEATVPSEKITEEETTLINNLNSTLANAQLNGLLDRTYNNQLSLQVSLLLSLISELAARTKDQQLYDILESYYANLSTINRSLENYSGS